MSKAKQIFTTIRKKRLIVLLAVLVAISIVICYFFLLYFYQPIYQPKKIITPEGLSLKIETDKEAYEVGEDIKINIILINENTYSVTFDIWNDVDNKFFYITNSTNYTIWSPHQGLPSPYPISSTLTIDGKSEKVITTYVWNQTFRFAGDVIMPNEGKQVPPIFYTVKGRIDFKSGVSLLDGEKTILIES